MSKTALNQHVLDAMTVKITTVMMIMTLVSLHEPKYLSRTLQRAFQISFNA